MKNKFLILFLFLLSINVLAVETQPSKRKCALPGETAGGSAIGSLACCTGFISTDKWMHENFKKLGCNISPPPGSWGSCAKCGDHLCDSKNYENHCNCPSDCP